MRAHFRYPLWVAAAALAACGGPPPLAQSAVMPARSQPGFISQSSSYKVLYRFPPSMGGGRNGPLLDVNRTLYGTTTGNDTTNDGSVYSITAGGHETTVHIFAGGSSDGSEPSGPLANANGTLYGTTILGGTCGKGIVYSITPGGTETLLHSFCGNDGTSATGLTKIGNMLYGTATYNISDYTKGTIFEVSTTGKFKVLYAFGSKSGDALGPQGPPIEVKGALYGTTVSGGDGHCDNGFGCGAVYRVSLTGKEEVLYGFQGGVDGSAPIAGVTDIGGTLYGTTDDGGSYKGHNGRKDSCCGTFYRLTVSGKHDVLSSFAYHPGASFPNTTLIEMSGTLYGTSPQGGSDKAGTVYSITRRGSETVLHSFSGGVDGGDPQANLTNVNGTLYGTTDEGGDLKCMLSGLNIGCGVIFSVAP